MMISPYNRSKDRPGLVKVVLLKETFSPLLTFFVSYERAKSPDYNVC